MTGMLALAGNMLFTLFNSDTITELFYDGNSALIFGASTGAVIYVLTVMEKSVWQKVLSFLVSFVIGIQAAQFVTDIINYFLPEVIEIEPPLAAVLAAAISVRMVMSISRQSGSLFNWLKNRRGNKK